MVDDGAHADCAVLRHHGWERLLVNSDEVDRRVFLLRGEVTDGLGKMIDEECLT